MLECIKRNLIAESFELNLFFNNGIPNINNKPDLLLGELVEKLKIQVSQLLKMPIKHGIDTFVIGLMDYINANDIEEYRELIEKLDIRK